MQKLTNDKSLNGKARKLLKARETYHDAWVKATAQRELLKPARFWAILKRLKDIRILSLSGPYCDASKRAADELFRLCQCDELEASGRKVTFDELVSFIANWDALVDKLHTVLFDVVTGKGDDSYGDLCDSLPLVGRAGVKKLLTMKEGAHSNVDVENVIRTHAADGTDYGPDVWWTYIWQGENYWRMMLDDAAEERYLYEARDNDPEVKEEQLV